MSSQWPSNGNIGCAALREIGIFAWMIYRGRAASRPVNSVLSSRLEGIARSVDD
jgi:hypothetical protein